MEMITSKEMDLRIILCSFDGCAVRVFFDKETENVYCNLDDLELILTNRPEKTTYKDWAILKTALMRTINKLNS